jgi:hypothetical protein
LTAREISSEVWQIWILSSQFNQKRYDGGVVPIKMDGKADYYAQVVSQIIKYDPAIVAMDANVSPDVLSTVIQHCNEANITSESLATDTPIDHTY